jgi:serine phosphatase RsbU (regulator of sigma subunit)
MDFLQSIITAIYFAFGGGLLFLAYTIIKTRFANRLNRITGIMIFFAGLGPIFIALGSIISPNVSSDAPFESSLIHNLLYIWELFFPSFLLFSWVFPVDRLSMRKFWRLRYLIFLPHIFHILLVIAFRNPEKLLNFLDVGSGEGFVSLILGPISYLLKFIILGFSLLLHSQETLFATINLIYALTAAYFIIRGRKLVANILLRNQISIIIWGILIAIGLYIIAFLIPEMFSMEIPALLQTVILIVALLAGGSSIGWSIIKYQFLDISLIVRQSLVYTISSGILVGLYILIFGQIDEIITATFGSKTNIVNIAFIILALVLFQPINSQLDNLIQKLFLKNRTDYRNIMEILSRRLISVFEPDQIRAMIEKTLTSTLLVEKIYFILFDDTLNEYALLPSHDYPKKLVISRDDLLLGGVGQLEAPSVIARLAEYREGSRLSEEMDKRHIELILPLKDANHLLGFLALTQKASGFRYSAEDITMLGVISNQLVTVLTNSRLYADSLEKQRLDEEISMARQIQLDLLPKCPPHSELFNICAYSLPSRTIGGDFYDFIPKNDGAFGIVIADASGKGMPAALLVTQIQAMMRSEVGNNMEISKALYNVNRHVVATTSAERFVTLFYGEFNPATLDFNYANAGHNYPILVRADGSHELLTKGGILLGAFPEAKYDKESVKLLKDDLIFFYTDGLSEAQNQKDEEFGEKRILEYIVKNRERTPADIVEGILADVRRFDQTEPPRDDTTLVIMKITQGF